MRSPENGGMALRSETYTLYPCDLRDPPSSTLGKLLDDGTLLSETPTLFISECVFAYMPQNASVDLIQWFATSFKVVGGLLYEMFALNDNFGSIMRQNLMVCLILRYGNRLLRFGSCSLEEFLFLE